MLLPRQEKVTFKPALPSPAYALMQGQTGAVLPPPTQLPSSNDQMTMLLAALLTPQAPPPQVNPLLALAGCQAQLRELMDVLLALSPAPHTCHMTDLFGIALVEHSLPVPSWQAYAHHNRRHITEQARLEYTQLSVRKLCRRGQGQHAHVILQKVCKLLQVTDANLQLAQLLLAAQLQAPAMQSPLTVLPQAHTAGEYPANYVLPVFPYIPSRLQGC